jgi:hypothetical protein
MTGGAAVAYLLVGILAGLAIGAVAAAMARRRRLADDALTRAYGPAHALLSENAAARAKVAEIEKRLMDNYSPESAPYSPAEKKAAAEAFLAAEAAITADVVAVNWEKMKEVVATSGHLLDDADFLALADETATAAAARLLRERDLPKVLRDPPARGDAEGALLDQIRERFLALSAERRAGFFAAFFAGLKHLFATR